MKTTLSNILTPAALAVSLLAASCSSDDDGGGNQPPSNPATITAGVNSLGLTTLASVLSASGLDATLAGTGPFTLFAPTNAAFAALDATTLAFLTDPVNVAVLQDALEYHVLSADVDSATAAGLTGTTALNMDDLNIDSVNGSLYINDGRVVTADQVTGNGRIHVIDSVLLPPTAIATAASDRGLSNLLAAVGASSLDLSAAPVTVFAPSDAAFEAFAVAEGNTDFADFLAGAAQVDVDALLNGHIVAGAMNTASGLATGGDTAAASGNLLFFDAPVGVGARVDGIPITNINVPTTQSLIHEVGTVIEARDDVVMVATASGLNTLVANVGSIAGLDAFLTSQAALTVFAPSDAAWAEPSLANLQMAGNEAALEEVLRYHVVADAIQAAELVTLTTVDNIDADTITIVDNMDGTYSLSTNPGNADNVTALIEVTDVFAANAAVHVIDTVMLPPGFVLP